VGLGGSTGIDKHAKDGTVAILDAADLSYVKDLHDATEYIKDLKFSSDGSMLAAASEDTTVSSHSSTLVTVFMVCQIYIYQTADWAIRNTLRAHSSPVARIDFSVDSMYLQSCSDDHQLLYWSMQLGDVTDPSTLKEVSL
jgi:WD40 repeat protein